MAADLSRVQVMSTAEIHRTRGYPVPDEHGNYDLPWGQPLSTQFADYECATSGTSGTTSGTSGTTSGTSGTSGSASGASGPASGTNDAPSLLVIAAITSF